MLKRRRRKETKFLSHLLPSKPGGLSQNYICAKLWPVTPADEERRRMRKDEKRFAVMKVSSPYSRKILFREVSEGEERGGG